MAALISNLPIMLLSVLAAKCVSAGYRGPNPQTMHSLVSPCTALPLDLNTTYSFLYLFHYDLYISKYIYIQFKDSFY